MKIMTLLGTRPEIIRLSRIIEKLDRHADHTLVHTGQNFDDRLNGLFFREMGIRAPDVFLEARGASAADRIGQILARSEEVFLRHRPDRLLVLGDTNSGLSAMIARRLGIPVYHMEAGNRCHDDRVPEEVNRRVIDHCSSVLMPYTRRSRENLLREGIPGDRIYVTGNPIKEVIDSYRDRIDVSPILSELGLETERYFLATIHRAENVDVKERFADLVDGLERLHQSYGFPVVCSFHPRTRAKAGEFGLDLDRPGLRFVEPFGFFDFIQLERSAFCLLSDSGTVQEEGCLFGVPNVTLRDVTERPETVECGSNFLSGSRPEKVLEAVAFAVGHRGRWSPPAEYLRDNVSDTVCRIVLGYRAPDRAEEEWIRRAPGEG